MTASRDKSGRPIVVVTGMGVVTSLGSGKSDNWAKLTAGESGIRTITRFSILGLKTTMAGTVDFVPVEPCTSTDLSERLADIAAEEAIAESAIGSKGDFPGPLFLAVAPIEVEWPQRQELGRAIGETDIDYDAILRVSGGGRYTAYHRRFMLGSVADHQAEVLGTKGSPLHGMRIGRHRHSARRGSHSPRRDRRGAVRCNRRFGQSGSPGPLLIAVGAVDP